MARPKKSVSVPVENIYNLTLTLNDKVFKASSPDYTEAILALKPEKITTRGIFHMEYNGKHSELMKNGTLTKLICANRLRAYAIGKNLNFLLK